MKTIDNIYIYVRNAEVRGIITYTNGVVLSINEKAIEYAIRQFINENEITSYEKLVHSRKLMITDDSLINKYSYMRKILKKALKNPILDSNIDNVEFIGEDYAVIDLNYEIENKLFNASTAQSEFSYEIIDYIVDYAVNNNIEDVNILVDIFNITYDNERTKEHYESNVLPLMQNEIIRRLEKDKINSISTIIFHNDNGKCYAEICYDDHFDTVSIVEACELESKGEIDTLFFIDDRQVDAIEYMQNQTDNTFGRDIENINNINIYQISNGSSKKNNSIVTYKDGNVENLNEIETIDLIQKAEEEKETTKDELLENGFINIYTNDEEEKTNIISKTKEKFKKSKLARVFISLSAFAVALVSIPFIKNNLKKDRKDEIVSTVTEKQNVTGKSEIKDDNKKIEEDSKKEVVETKEKQNEIETKKENKEKNKSKDKKDKKQEKQKYTYTVTTDLTEEEMEMLKNLNKINEFSNTDDFVVEKVNKDKEENKAKEENEPKKENKEKNKNEDKKDKKQEKKNIKEKTDNFNSQDLEKLAQQIEEETIRQEREYMEQAEEEAIFEEVLANDVQEIVNDNSKGEELVVKFSNNEELANLIIAEMEKGFAQSYDENIVKKLK